MKQLWNKTQNTLLVPHLEVATGFIDRGIGLLKKSSLTENEGLWIHRCNSIHTFFMRFSIDCVFVDQNLVVQDLVQDVAPWKLVLPRWSSRSVFELPSGLINKFEIKKGDQLDVVS
ncbi:MAG: DUF192 domain-containing protein [Bdellovibrionaceae bacterium]|nr:DUF192 domain-containing protein [Pseudobdellovibrionaceae bacterium]